jgi:phosphate transport system protein
MAAPAWEDSQDSPEREPCRPEGTHHEEATVPETRRSFDDQLTDIRTSVVTLAAKSCEQIGAATQALLDADLPLVDRIYAAHREIEGLVLHVEQQVYQLFALQQPMASDLRTLLAILRILHEIELTAGLMRNVARATRRLYPRELPPRIRGIIERMGAQASVQTRLAVDAFADQDASTATALPDMDDVMDDLQKELFRAIFNGFAGAADEAALQMAVQLAFVGRDFERAADHAVMIARWVSFMVTGELPGDPDSSDSTV